MADETEVPPTETLQADPAPGTFTDADMIDMGEFGKALDGATADAVFDAAADATARALAAADPAIEIPGITEPPKAIEPVLAEKTGELPVAPQSTTREWKLNGKTFKSAEEMANYAQGIEDAQRALTDSAIVPNALVEKFEDVIFEDAAKAKKLLRDEFMAEVKAETEATRRINEAAVNTQNFWNQFYNANPDLKAHARFVDAELPGLKKDKGDIALSVAAPILAERARATLKKIAQDFSPSKELPAKSATTAGASGAQVPTRPQVEQVVSFADAIRAANKKGRLQTS